MCYFTRIDYSCGDWEWGKKIVVCPHLRHTHSDCGVKQVHSDRLTVSNPCEICQSIEAKNRQLEKVEQSIQRWTTQARRYHASLANHIGARDKLNKEIQTLDSRRQPLFPRSSRGRPGYGFHTWSNTYSTHGNFYRHVSTRVRQGISLQRPNVPRIFSSTVGNSGELVRKPSQPFWEDLLHSCPGGPRSSSTGDSSGSAPATQVETTHAMIRVYSSMSTILSSMSQVAQHGSLEESRESFTRDKHAISNHHHQQRSNVTYHPAIGMVLCVAQVNERISRCRVRSRCLDQAAPLDMLSFPAPVYPSMRELDGKSRSQSQLSHSVKFSKSSAERLEQGTTRRNQKPGAWHDSRGECCFMASQITSFERVTLTRRKISVSCQSPLLKTRSLLALQDFEWTTWSNTVTQQFDQSNSVLVKKPFVIGSTEFPKGPITMLDHEPEVDLVSTTAKPVITSQPTSIRYEDFRRKPPQLAVLFEPFESNLLLHKIKDSFPDALLAPTVLSGLSSCCYDAIDSTGSGSRQSPLVATEASLMLLCFAVFGGRTDMVHSIIRAGVSVNQRDRRTGFTPIHYAILGRSPEMVRLLIEYGASVPDHDTALHVPETRWVGRILAGLAHSTEPDSNSTLPCHETSSGGEGKRKHGAIAYTSASSSPIRDDNSPRSSSLNVTSWNDREGQSQKRRKSSKVQPPVSDPETHEKFACPYAKFDPGMFGDRRNCGLIGYDNIPRLKEHLHRDHRIYNCERCGLSCDDEPTLNAHTEADTCIKKPMLARNHCDGFVTRKANKIRDKWRNKDGPYKWREMYKILFEVHEASALPSPYFESRAQLRYVADRLMQELQEALGPKYSSAQEARQHVETLRSKIERDFTQAQARLPDSLLKSSEICGGHCTAEKPYTSISAAQYDPGTISTEPGMCPDTELGIACSSEQPFLSNTDLQGGSGLLTFVTAARSGGAAEYELNVQQSSSESIDGAGSYDSMPPLTLTSGEDLFDGIMPDACATNETHFCNYELQSDFDTGDVMCDIPQEDFQHQGNESGKVQTSSMPSSYGWVNS